MGESATLRMAQKARELRAEGRDIIALSLGEPDFDTPECIKEAAKQALDEGFTKYTPVAGLAVLREAICQKLEEDNQLHYSPEQIVVSNGAKQSIANICLALLNPGDEVLVFSPYWVSYKAIIKLTGAKPVFVSAGIEQDYKISARQFEEALTEKTKLIIYSSPCNPTGAVFRKEELESFAQVIRKQGREDLIVLSDEIYEYINFSAEGHTSIASLEGMAERTVVVNGFSKGFAMTGWRLGYIAAPLWLAQACTKIQGQFTSGATSFGQKAAAEALLNYRSETETMRKAFLERKKLVVELLEAIPGLKVNNPEGAFYVFPDISAFFSKGFADYQIKTSEDLAEYLLHEAHVAVVAGEAFGANDCIRISYASSEELLKDAFKRIAQALAQLR